MSNRIKIEIHVNDNLNINKESILKNNLRDILEVEGTLGITIDGKVVFLDKYCALLELLIYFEKWKRSIEKNRIVDFIYKSIESEESPLLAFEKIDLRMGNKIGLAAL